MDDFTKYDPKIFLEADEGRFRIVEGDAATGDPVADRRATEGAVSGQRVVEGDLS